MVSMILAEFRQTWKMEVRNLFKNGKWMLYVYFLTLVPYWFAEDKAMVVRYFALMVPILLSMLARDLHPMRITKTLFLCPLSEEERVRYITCGYTARMVLSFVLYAVGLTIVYVFQPVSIWKGAGLAIPFLINMAVYHMHVETFGAEKEGIRVYGTPYTEYHAWYVCIVCLGAINWMIVLKTACTPVTIWWGSIVVSSMLLVQGLTGIAFIRKYYHRCVRWAAEYERSDRSRNETKND